MALIYRRMCQKYTYPIVLTQAVFVLGVICKQYIPLKKIKKKFGASWARSACGLLYWLGNTDETVGVSHMHRPCVRPESVTAIGMALGAVDPIGSLTGERPGRHRRLQTH